MRSYIGLIRRNDVDGELGVFFPDFPDVIAVGTTLDDARGAAEDALARHIEGRTEIGETIPASSSLEEVMSNAGNRDGVAILISVRTEQSKAIRVNVTMPEDVLTQLDEYARTHGFTRSRLLTKAVRKLLNGTA